MPQSLDDIMSGRDASAPVEQAPEPITDAERAANPIGAARRERDEQGRFARQQEEAQKTEPQDEEEGEQPEPTAEPKRQPGSVPKQALEAERRKRQDYEQQLAAMQRELAEMRGAVMARQQPQPAPQQQPEPPEFWTDPNAATDFRVRNALDPVNQQIQQMTLAYSQRFATQEHGAEAVQAAIQALSGLRQTNPGEFSRLEAQAGQSMDPVGDVVRWHKQQRALTEIGSDPDAFRKRIREEILAELQQQGAASEAQPAPQPRLPTNFAGRPSGGPRGGAGYGGPRPLSELMPRG